MQPEGAIELELLFRAGAQWPAAASQRSLRERAERLAADCSAVEVTVRPVERYVSLDDSERFRTFQSWAKEQGVSLLPAFDVRLRRGAGTDTREVLVPPIVVLAVHRQGALSAVYPHSDGDDHRSVGAALTALDAELAGEDRRQPA